MGEDTGGDGAPRRKWVITPDDDLFQAQLAELRGKGWRISRTAGFPAIGDVYFQFPGLPLYIWSHFAFMEQEGAHAG